MLDGRHWLWKGGRCPGNRRTVRASRYHGTTSSLGGHGGGRCRLPANARNSEPGGRRGLTASRDGERSPSGVTSGLVNVCVSVAPVSGMARSWQGGPQPQTRSDWQLLSDGSAIWVVGSYPRGCSGTIPADTPANFVFQVAQDTLQPLGAGSALVRRYLLYAQ